MSTIKRFYLCFFFTVGVVLLSQEITAAIYYPLGNPVTLALAIGQANGTLQDDIIDLGGFSYFISENCSVTDPADCSGTAPLMGWPALPPIESASTSGSLSIVKGTIIRLNNEVNDAFRILNIEPGAYVTLYNLTITNGWALPGSLEGSFPAPIEGAFNLPDPSAFGGGIFNMGNLTMKNSVVDYCLAGESGGGIYNDEGSTLFVEGGSISNNTSLNSSGGYGGGGGIFNVGGGEIPGNILKINNTTLANNITRGYGAGINNQGIATLISNSTISNNYCCTGVAGGICPNPPTGSGGGIYNDGLATLLILENTTIAGNVAYQGGGIYNNSSNPGVSIYNSTIARNNAYNGGGGIYNNNNGNVSNLPSVISNLASNIIAINTDDSLDSIPDFQNFDESVPSATIVQWRNNFVGDNFGVSLHIFFGDNHFDISGVQSFPVDPLLAPLDYNGGPTLTMALLPGSPAVNNGWNPLSLYFDQRGQSYHRTICGHTDIGSFESQYCSL